MLSGDAESKEKMQREVLQLWDQIYEKWFVRVSRHRISSPQPCFMPFQVISSLSLLILIFVVRIQLQPYDPLVSCHVR